MITNPSSVYSMSSKHEDDEYAYMNHHYECEETSGSASQTSLEPPVDQSSLHSLNYYYTPNYGHNWSHEQNTGYNGYYPLNYSNSGYVMYESTNNSGTYIHSPGTTSGPEGPPSTNGSQNTPSPTEFSEDGDPLVGDIKRPYSLNHGLSPPIKKSKGNGGGKRSKKRNKDPNEPQKPVSAYALFFRDTQAAIKLQNPNATFGEVSKHVAALWDGLNPDNKAAYKKRTETAKKDYLKQLAAYRATLVSMTKNGSDLSYNGYGGPSYVPPYNTSSLETQQQGLVKSKNTNCYYGNNNRSSSNYSPVSQPSMHDLVLEQNVLGYGGGGETMTSRSHDESQSQRSPILQDSPTSKCSRSGCGNMIPHWSSNSEFCSNECVVGQCRDAYVSWNSSGENNSNSSQPYTESVK